MLLIAGGGGLKTILEFRQVPPPTQSVGGGTCLNYTPSRTGTSMVNSHRLALDCPE